MAKDGWGFWIKRGDWRDVYFVRIADHDRAMDTLLSTLGTDVQFEKFVELSSDVFDFLGIAEWQIKPAHVLRTGGGDA
jgi:hypothetical protein